MIFCMALPLSTSRYSCKFYLRESAIEVKKAVSDSPWMAIHPKRMKQIQRILLRFLQKLKQLLVEVTEKTMRPVARRIP